MANPLAPNNDMNENPVESTSCGLGSWSPQFLQKFASPKVYLIVFCLSGIAQGTYYMYLIGVASTLEKRFSYDSQFTGLILLADNISPAIFSIMLGYFGKYFHKPKVVYFGMMINVFSCFLACVPYFLFGPKIKTSVNEPKKNIPMCSASHNFENCSELIRESIIAICFLFTANFLKGIGSSAFYTVGMPYLDDNVKKKNSPMYLGVTFAIRVLCPTLGLWLSSFCLKFYENPFVEPEFGVNDSQWIGAWWIGFLFLGLVLFITSLPILCFPRYIQRRPVPEIPEVKNYKKSIYDLFIALKKLFHNPILIFHTLSIIFQINGFFGYLSFMPKYIENQFHSSASSANWYSGHITLWASVPVALFSGFVISRFKPRPKFLTGYMMFVQVFAGAVMIVALFIYCDTNTGSETNLFLFHEEKECNSPCSCNQTSFAPICDIYGVSHFSPCSAGCHSMYKSSKTMMFGNCSCISADHNSTVEVQATKGICSGLCYSIWPYIVIISLTKLLASSARVGNILITLRCVDEADKSLALGTVEFFVSVLATIPNPILYGYVFDQSCLLWEKSCGVQGNCLFYDSTLLRHYIHLVSVTFILLGACCDIIVFTLSSRLNYFYEEAVQIQQPDQELVEA